MNLAKNKYKTLVRAGECKAPDEDQKEVLALRAQIKELKSQKGNCCNVKLAGKRKLQVTSKPLSHTRTKSITGARNTKCGQSTRQKTASCPTRRIRMIKAMRITPKTSGNWPRQ